MKLSQKLIFMGWMALFLSVLMIRPASAQSPEIAKSCEFKAVGLKFESRLLRSQGTLAGYELSVKNSGDKELNLEHPANSFEAADATIFETSADGKRRTRVDAEFFYPMHGPIEGQQKWFRGKLKAGERKIFTVAISDALKKNYVLSTESAYDISIRSVLYLESDQIAKEESRRIFGDIRSEINFSDCLGYVGVKFNQPGGR